MNEALTYYDVANQHISYYATGTDDLSDWLIHSF